ncbi:calpastatin [Magnaporthiopsis poae ATCC 64411]|uniref:Calpastatin n=1 Tax=Magnaporthiopsis poae (strain ATCC 64411 / 73-15) TaxID=644358 RepID=A0A0C4EAZ3_MAGP6|nr:calpastatin [Magnaporthiopsis poae ATCC 64411]
MPPNKAKKKRPRIRVRLPPWPSGNDDAEGEDGSSSSSSTGTGTGTGTGHAAATSSESSGSPAAGGLRRITDDDRGVHLARLEVQRAAGVRRVAKKTVRFRTPPREADEKRLSDEDREIVDRAVGAFKTFAGMHAGTDLGAGAVDGVAEDEVFDLEALHDEFDEESIPLDADDDGTPRPSKNAIDPYNIYRFESAQGQEGEVYERALAELIQCRKQTHWTWFMVPAGCGRIRRTSVVYHTTTFPNIDKLMGGSGDAKKLQSSMTLFAVAAQPEDDEAAAEEPLWQQVLNVFFEGERDDFTVRILSEETD